jgi:poly-beta-1,6-N-acetyl-D-glucosamine synthase
VCYHHRKLGTGTGNHDQLRMRFHYGLKAYYVGGHPIWELMRGIFSMRQSPYVFGGVMFLAGFAWAAITRTPRVVSRELMAFHRAEQMRRLRETFGFRTPSRASVDPQSLHPV